MSGEARGYGYHPCCGTDCIDVRDLTRERDEARAEVERLRESLEWSEACRKARLSMAETCLNGRAEGKSPCGACSICCGDLNAEIAHLRRGIEAYRTICVCPKEVTAGKQHVWQRDRFGDGVPCESCEWEREDAKRRESGDER